MINQEFIDEADAMAAEAFPITDDMESSHVMGALYSRGIFVNAYLKGALSSTKLLYEQEGKPWPQIFLP